MNPSSTTSASQFVTYRYLEAQDIHVLTFHKATREAAQEGLEHVLRVYEKIDESQTVRLLLDLRQSGMLPFTSVISQGRMWTKRVNKHPKARLALLTRPDALHTLVTQVFNMLRFNHLKTQVFEGDAQADAIAWLSR